MQYENSGGSAPRAEGWRFMSKVTMQDLADALQVSRITVWKALTNRPGVSDKLRRTVQDKAAEMGYVQTDHPSLRGKSGYTFSAVVSRPESSVFWMQIIHHFAKELAAHGISLMYTYMPTSYQPGYELPASLDGERVDGFVVLNVYSREMLSLLAQSPLPKVFLDSLPSLPGSALGGDLVMLEGRACIREITGRLLDRGYRRLGFVGDVNYATTNRDRYQGFVDAHGERGLAPEEALCMKGPIGLRSHYEEISHFLDGLPALPDAFVCPSDFIAHYIQRYLTERGVPEDAAPILTGFDNNTEYANVAGKITTVDVDTAALGKRLARQLIYRADFPHAPLETTYVAGKTLYQEPLK